MNYGFFNATLFEKGKSVSKHKKFSSLTTGYAFSKKIAMQFKRRSVVISPNWFDPICH